MKDTRIARICCGFLCISLSLARFTAQSPAAQSRQTVIAAALILDGRGGMTRHSRVVVRDGRIVALDPAASPVDIDLEAGR